MSNLLKQMSKSLAYLWQDNLQKGEVLNVKSNRLINLLIPLISVFIGLVAGGIIMLIYGYNPIAGFSALWNGAFGDIYFIGETLRQVTPYILTGLAVPFAFRAGLLNIVGVGQVLVGWLVAALVGLLVVAPICIPLSLAVLATAVVGGLYGFIPGILKAKLGVHEVIVTIMLKYIALYSANSIIRDVLTDRAD